MSYVVMTLFTYFIGEVFVVYYEGLPPKINCLLTLTGPIFVRWDLRQHIRACRI